MENTLKPVMVQQIIKKEGSESAQVLLTQEVEREINSVGGLATLAMLGHSKFTTGPTTRRSCFLTMSQVAIDTYGVIEGHPLPAVFKEPKIIIREYVVGEALNEDDKKFILNASVFTPWKTLDGRVQEPKKQGAEGGILVRDNQPIYRNSYLSVKGMPNTDKLIEHNGVLPATPVATNTAEESISSVNIQ